MISIPILKVEFANDSLQFEIKDNMGIFKGKVNEDITKIEGQWKQNDLKLPLTLMRGLTFQKKASHQYYLIVAYFLIWIALFIYIWNLLKKQKNLAREVELLRLEKEKK
jgi:CcmD family protein